jgi:Winged helix-turn-helix DNA-binding
MTPDEEALFIELWQHGASYADIAQALGIPSGTVSSRAQALVRQGKIQPRPRGGAYPRQQAKARQPLALSETTETAPVQTPVQNPVHNTVHNYAPHGAVHRPVHNHPDHPPPSPDLSGVLNALVERLSAIEETLKHGGVHKSAPEHIYASVQTYAPVQTSALTGVEPPKLSPEERKSERWNIYMPRWIRQRIERAAALEGISPSQFLQRLCGPWAATWQEPPEDTP